jgi:hypothetical protein
VVTARERRNHSVPSFPGLFPSPCNLAREAAFARTGLLTMLENRIFTAFG